MENTTQIQDEGMFKPALNNALLISVVLIIVTLIFYLVKVHQSTTEMVIAFVIFLAGLIYAIKTFRDQNLGGYISYGKSLAYSVMIGLFVGLVMGVFTFIFFSYVAPDLMETIRDKAIQKTESTMLQQNPNITDSELDTVINLQMKFISPVFTALGAIFGYVLQALVIGLIASIFMKKKNPDELMA